LEDIDYIKWWGAIVATIALAWNVYNTFLSAPKIKIRHKVNTTYPDARVVSTEVLENGERNTLASYCHIELVNVGRVSATIINIESTNSRKKKARAVTAYSETFLPHSEKKLPVLLSPGEVWSCRHEMIYLHNVAKHGKPEIRVSVSYKEKPIIVRLKI